MTDKKFTDEQIIEALEIRMPHDVICREAYDLINRQKAEIERIQKERRWGITLFELEAIEKHARNKAIKEFAERLKEKMYPYNGLDKRTYAINARAVEKAIEDLVKEMMENDK